MEYEADRPGGLRNAYPAAARQCGGSEKEGEEMKKQAIAILRVSTALQDMERQRRDITTAAKVHDLDIVRTLELPDLSGTKMLHDPEVRRVLDSLAKPGVDGC